VLQTGILHKDSLALLGNTTKECNVVRQKLVGQGLSASVQHLLALATTLESTFLVRVSSVQFLSLQSIA
jgi:hypothetical protein